MNIGAAYVYTRQDGPWGASTRFTRSDVRADGFFGHAVNISGNTLAVGAARVPTGGRDEMFVRLVVFEPW